MKKAILALSVLLAFVTTGLSCILYDSSQSRLFSRSVSLKTQAVRIPSPSKSLTAKTISDALYSASARATVNIYREEVGLNTFGSRTTLSVLLNTTSPLIQSIDLSRGRELQVSDTTRAGLYLSTEQRPGHGQVGTIRDYLGNDSVVIETLPTLFTREPPGGLYLLEGPEAQRRVFMDLFSRDLTSASGQEVSQASLMAGSAPAPVSGNGQLRKLALTGLAVTLLATFVLLAYIQVSEAKRTAVQRLHGYGATRLWWHSAARSPLLTYASAAAAMSVSAQLFVRDSSLGSLRYLLILHAVIFGTLALGSRITVTAVEARSLTQSLKNRKDTLPIFVLNGLMQAVSLAVLCAISAATLSSMVAAHATVDRLAAWSKVTHYSTFSPAQIGDDWSAVSSGAGGPLVRETAELYPKMNSRGALYIDASQADAQEGSSYKESSLDSSLVANPNYLKSYSVRASDGKIVSVSESETAWVILVPDTLRPREKMITAQAKSIRAEARRAEVNFSGTPFDGPADQPIRIIWTKPGQRVFAFDGRVNAQGDGCLVDPIIQVMTLSNSVLGDRAAGFSGDINAALKVRTPEGGPSAIRSLTPYLRTLHLDDNLHYLTSPAEYATGQSEDAKSEFRTGLGILGVALTLSLALTIQGAGILFDRYSREIVVSKLLGGTLRERYGKALTRYFVIAAAGSVLCFAIAGEFIRRVNPSASRFESKAYITLSLLGIVALECAVAVCILKRRERSRLSTVLKEEY